MSRLALTPVSHPALATAPTLPTLRAGDTYYDTSLGLLVYTGSAWNQVYAVTIDGGTPSTTSFTLTIDGGNP